MCFMSSYDRFKCKNIFTSCEGLCWCIIWPSFPFDCFVKIWATCQNFGQMVHCPLAKNCPYAYGLVETYSTDLLLTEIKSENQSRGNSVLSHLNPLSAFDFFFHLLKPRIQDACDTILVPKAAILLASAADRWPKGSQLWERCVWRQSWITFAHARVLTGRWFERKWSCVLLALFVVYFWICFSKLNVVVLGKPVISSMKITEKLHGQCFWSLTVARGVVLNDHLKMLAIQWGAVHVCDRSFHLTAYFCKTVYSLSMA